MLAFFPGQNLSTSTSGSCKLQQNLGTIGSDILTFIGKNKQTDRETNANFTYRKFHKISKVCVLFPNV